MTTQLKHEVILASAGSGKTYQLTLRFISLLVAGAEPGDIAALTFTRKAAGEFLEAILQRLAQAGSDHSKRDKLRSDLGLDSLTEDSVQSLLEKVIRCLHQLRLGTLDGFFNGFIQAYGLELGLPGSVDIVDGFQLEELRKQIWAQTFHLATGAEQHELMQICNEHTWGDANKKVASALSDFIDQNHGRFVRNPGAESWFDPYLAGDLKSVWPEHPVKDYHQRLDELPGQIDGLGLKAQARGKWQDFIGEIRDWQWGQPPPDLKGYILSRLLQNYEAIANGVAEMKFYRDTVSLDPALCSQLKVLLDQFAGSEWQRARHHTKLTYRLLQRYEQAYQDRVRRQGRLTFGDMPLLLQGLFTDNDPEWAFFRMDGRIQHWLLDEFQDTSREQWAALEPLIDEVLQDPSGSRSLFYVGDVKQSIYGWRGGDPLLFSEIQQRYADRIAELPLNVSYRSTWPVLRLVNAVCGNHDYLAVGLPEVAVERWRKVWSDHRPAQVLENLSGECRVAASEDDSLESKIELAIEWIREINPIERGLSCAILTLKNNETDAVIRQLRQSGIDCSREGEAAIASDNLPGRLLRAIFQVIAHPRDSLSLRMIEMSPIRWPGEQDGQALLRYIGRLRRETHRSGYTEATRQLITLIRQSVELDAFNELRCQQLLDAARDYDAMDLRSEAGFVEFLSSATVRESSDSGRIEVMTIHKSKGLGFDVVILPQLKRNKLDNISNLQFIYKAESGRSRGWVFKQPPAALAELDPLLRCARREIAERECFERFCQLYVALTRAKRGLYLVLGPEPKSSSSSNFENWIRDSLPQSSGAESFIYQDGDPAWFRHSDVDKQTTAPADSPTTPASEYPDSPSIVADTPSSPSEESQVRVAEWFASDEHALEKGTRLHDLLARIEWLESDAEAPLPELLQPEIRALFTKPQQPCEIWREQAFDLRLEERWVSGVFDRVVLLRDSQGAVSSARIIDFKTDTVTAESAPQRAEKYRSQLQRYRRALTALIGLETQQIQCSLAFIQPGLVIDMQD